jgi:hypothetical protein
MTRVDKDEYAPRQQGCDYRIVTYASAQRVDLQRKYLDSGAEIGLRRWELS